MCAYRILALDGGGIRGLITAMLLERLEHACPGFLDQIDLFAGTSTGGLLALGLAAGKSPHDARKLYETYGEKVFADTVLDNIRDLGTLLGADYSLQPLREALTLEFPGLRLRDLPKKVLVSSFDLDNQAQGQAGTRFWKPKFFHNFPGPDSDGDQWVVDVGLYTSAAPTYFPIVDGLYRWRCGGRQPQHVRPGAGAASRDGWSEIGRGNFIICWHRFQPALSRKHGW